MGDYMEQSRAREIIASLSSLYPLKDYEEEAINTLLNKKEVEWFPDEERDICPSCGNVWVSYLHDNFCRECGQPFERDDEL